MTKRLQTIALAALLLDEEERNEDTVLRTQKRSYWFHSWLQRRKEKDCYHNLFKELLLEDTKSFRESVSFNLGSISSSMFSAAMFLTNSLQILSLNIMNNFLKHTEYMLQTMGHVEIILKFVAETYFCCCNTAAKSKRFDFTAVLQQHFFMLQEVKFLLKPRGASYVSFLALAIQIIALQAREKCC